MAMKTIAIFLIPVFISIVSIISFAQVTDTKDEPKTSSVKKNVTSDKDKDKSIPNADSGIKKQNSEQKSEKGQIYIGSDWPLGTIVLRNGGMIDNYSLRYNSLTDQIQFIAGKDTLIYASPKELNTVTFGGHTFIYENYQCEDSIGQGYFELIVPGKNKLMLKRSVTSQKTDSKYPNDESLTKYQVDECYFISKPGLPANKILCKRKSALTFLNEYNDDIAEYLRITGNKVRTIDDLINLVSYYNSLDEEY